MDIKTPECDKMLAIVSKSQLIGEFLCWLDEEKGVDLMVLGDHGINYEPFYYNTAELLAEFFDIDLDKVEQEKRAILEEIRSNADVSSI